jgi:hypothetical protein
VDHPEGNQARDRHGKPSCSTCPDEKKKPAASSATPAAAADAS